MESSDWEPLFRLGRVVVTHEIQERLTVDEIRSALQRHVRGDWGEVGTCDRRRACPHKLHGCRIISAFQAANGTRFWVITAADRARTVVLLPEEY